MNIIYIIIPISLILGTSFVVAFLLSVKKGQYDDLETPAHRILFAENIENQKKTLEKSIREGALNGK